MKRNKQSKKIKKITWGFLGLLLISLLSILIISSILKKTQNQQIQKLTPDPQQKVNNYHSEILNITIDIPDGLYIKEENALRELILEKNGGIIKIHRFGTNRSYKNIKEFLDELYSSEDAPKNVMRKQINIEGKDCEISTADYKNYDCYLGSNSFLSIYTDTPELFSDLDQIAQSFRYEP